MIAVFLIIFRTMKEKLKFSAEELSELESLDIRGGFQGDSTNATQNGCTTQHGCTSQTKCTTYRYCPPPPPEPVENGCVIQYDCTSQDGCTSYGTC